MTSSSVLRKAKGTGYAVDSAARLASVELRVERLAERSVHIRCFLGLQVFNHAYVKVIGDWIRFHQDLLHRINPDPAF